jgi:hypothetical protein
MKTYGGVDVQIHVFLTSELVSGQLRGNRKFRSDNKSKAYKTVL